MIYIGAKHDGAPWDVRRTHCTTSGASSWARRNIGPQWQERWKVCYGTDYERWGHEQKKTAPRKLIDRGLNWVRNQLKMLGELELKELFGYRREYFFGKYRISKEEWRQLHGYREVKR